jgi:hypothetical protein
VLGLAFLGPFFFLPLFMVNVVGLTATNSGLTTTPLTFGIVAGNVLSGQLVSRMGRYKPLLLIATAILIVGFAIMGWTLASDAGQLDVSLKMILVGFGIGPSIPLFTLAIQNAVQPQQIGVATSAATFFRQMGMTVGIAIVGTVFATSLQSNMTANVGAVMKDAPPQMVEKMQESQKNPRAHFDRKAIDASIDADFDQKESSAPLAAKQGMEQGRAAAHATIAKVDAAMKEAFTDAVSRVFRVSMLIAIFGLLVIFTLPELPLRKGFGPPPAAE